MRPRGERADHTGEASIEVLARAARRGSDTAFEALVSRTQKALQNYLRLHTGNFADAEEIAQEAYLRAWRSIERYDPDRRFLPWLFTLAWRLWVGRLRRDRPEVDGEGVLASIPAVAGSGALDCDVWDVVRSILPPESVTALWLRYAEDLTAREIGAVLGKTEGAVRVLLHRARERVAPHLDAPSTPLPRPEPARPFTRIGSSR